MRARHAIVALLLIAVFTLLLPIALAPHARAIAMADLTVSASDDVTQYTPGSSVTYAITVANLGPSDAIGIQLVDALPAQLVNATWSAVFTGSGSSGAAGGSGSIDETISLPEGGMAQYTVSAVALATATGTLTNTVTVTAPAGIDPNGANNSATDTDTCLPVCDLATSMTDSRSTYSPGRTTTYTIVVANTGPSFAHDATVTDTMPASVETASWTAVFSGEGSSGATSGTGGISEPVDLAVAGSATYTLKVLVGATALGDLTNTVLVAPPAGAIDPSPADDSATDVDAYAAPPAIDVLSPQTARVGATVTIVGTGFGDAQGAVTFAGAHATVQSWTAGKVVCTVPASATGRVSIVVSDSADSPSAAAVFSVKPWVRAISPARGSSGATVTIWGSGFGAPRGTSKVLFGNKAVGKYVSWSPTRIKVRPPHVAKGRKAVAVSTSGGRSNSRYFRRI